MTPLFGIIAQTSFSFHTYIRYTYFMAATLPLPGVSIAVQRLPKSAMVTKLFVAAVLVLAVVVWPTAMGDRLGEIAFVDTTVLEPSQTTVNDQQVLEPSCLFLTKIVGVSVPRAVKSSLAAVVEAAELSPPEIRFLVLSDLHIRQADPETLIPPDVTALIPHVIDLDPVFVVITGDFTSGDEEAQFRRRTVTRWWQAVQQALLPLREAGIPVLPIPGNHDLYRERHREGYQEAWRDLAEWVHPFQLVTTDDGQTSGHPPFYYALEIAGLHLTLLDVSSRSMAEEQLVWLDSDLNGAQSADLRLAFGHIPLQSIMGRRSSNARLERRLGPVLTDHGVDAYFCGHEHLVWDSIITVESNPDQTIRQVVSGIAGGGYTHRIGYSQHQQHCIETTCVLPASGFEIPVANREPVDETTFVLVETNGDELSIQPYALRDDQIVPLERAMLDPNLYHFIH